MKTDELIRYHESAEKHLIDLAEDEEEGKALASIRAGIAFHRNAVIKLFALQAMEDKDLPLAPDGLPKIRADES